MKVILRTDVKNFGKAGEIKEISKGYARNYIIPKGLGLIANDKNKKILENEKAGEKRAAEKYLKEAQEIAAQLEKVSCTINVKVGADEKMFGSVTNADIAENLNSQGIKIDKKHVHIENPLKELGVYTIDIKLHPELTGKVKLWIVKES